MQNWNDLIRTQLDNLASFPAKQTWKLGEWIGECRVRPGVANAAALPLVGNEIGDVRASTADQAWYIWDGAAWQSMGGGGGGGVASVTASAPIASSGGANPNISLTGIVAAANGGTGIAASGALGNVLTSNGAGGWVSSAPATTSPAAPLTSLQFNNAGAFGGSAALTWNGTTLQVDGAVDRATAGTLTIGGTTANAITIGQIGVTTSFPGPVNLTGDVTTVGGTQFTTDAQFDGNVTFGNAASDNISFVGQVDTAITQEGIAAPAVSPAGTGRIYFDSGTNTFKASQNGGAYVDLITAATTPAAPLNSVQFNNAGAFGGSANLTYNSGTSTLGSAAALNLEAAADSTWNVTGANLTLSTTGGGPGRDVTIQSGNEVYINAGGVGDSVIVNSGYNPTNFQVRDQNFGSQPVFFVDGSTGFAGFKTSTPASLLSVGATSQFQVDSSGNIVAIRGQTTSFPAANAAGALTNDGAGNLSWTPASGGTITGSGTATQIAYFTGASAIGSETAVGSNSLTWDSTNNRLGVRTAAPSYTVDVQGGTLASGDRSLNVEGTLTAGGSNTLASFNATVSSGTFAQGIGGGLTGSGTPVQSFGAYIGNGLAGTGTDPINLQGNTGVHGNATGATGTGHNVGMLGYASQGARNYGMFGNTTLDGAGANVAVAGVAKNASGVRVAGLFSNISITAQPNVDTSAVLIADNNNTSDPIFLARDAGTTVFTIANDGAVTSKNTANSTTAFQVQNAASTTIFDVDTTNDRVGILTNTPVAALDVASGQLAIPDGTAAAPAVAFRDDLNTGFFSPSNDIVGVAVNGSEVARFQQTSTGNTPTLLMGTTSVVGAVTVDSSYEVAGVPTALAGVAMIAHGAAGTTTQESSRGGQYAGLRTRGTKAAPQAVGSGDGLVNLFGAGYTSAGAYNYGGLITIKAEQAYTSTASGGRVEIHTTTNGTDGATTLGSSATERVRIANDGRVSIGQSGGVIVPAAAGSILTLSGGLTQSAGAVSLTGNAASSFTTSAGDLTLTGGANLQLGAAFGSEVVVNEFASNVDFRVESTTNTHALFVDANAGANLGVGVGTSNVGTHLFNVGSGASSNFAVASGGFIHTYGGASPTDGQVLIGHTANGRFQAATLTAGTGISVTNGAGSITIAATGAAASTSTDVTGYVAQEALNAGDLVRFVNDAGTPKVQKADATNTDARLNPVGFAVAAALAGAAVTVRVAGVADVPVGRFDAAPAVTDVGKRVFVSTTSGQITLTAPSATGDILQRAGVLVDGSGSPKVLVQVGDPTLL